MHPDNSPAQIHTVGDRHDDWSRVHAPLFQTQWAVVRMRMIQTFDLWTTDPKTPVALKIDAGGDQKHTILLQWPYSARKLASIRIERKC